MVRVSSSRLVPARVQSLERKKNPNESRSRPRAALTGQRKVGTSRMTIHRAGRVNATDSPHSIRRLTGPPELNSTSNLRVIRFRLDLVVRGAASLRESSYIAKVYSRIWTFALVSFARYEST